MSISTSFLVAYLKSAGDLTGIFQIHFVNLCKTKLSVLWVCINLIFEGNNVDHIVIYENPYQRLGVLYANRHLVPFCEVEISVTGGFKSLGGTSFQLN